MDTERTVYLRWNILENGGIEILVDEPNAEPLAKFLKSKKFRVRKKEAIPASTLLSKPALISIRFRDDDAKAQALIDAWALKNT